MRSLDQQVSRDEVIDSAVSLALDRVIKRCRFIEQTENSIEMIFYNDIHIKVFYLPGAEGDCRYTFQVINKEREAACVDSYHERTTNLISADRVAYYLTNYALSMGLSVMEEA